MKKIGLFKLLSIITLAAAGVLGIANLGESKKAEAAEAGSINKSSIVLVIEDQVGATHDGRDPCIHIWNYSIDSSMEYDSSDLAGDLDASGAIIDFWLGQKNYRNLNSDGSIDSSFTSAGSHDGKTYWKIQFPWYIKGFTFQIFCGSNWGPTHRTVSSHGSYMVYLYGSWNSFDQSIGAAGSSGESNTYAASTYTISTAVTGGAPSSTNTAQVKGNGGSYVTSGTYILRQKISLKATAGTYSTFDSWDYGHDTSSSTTYDYVGSDKTYTAHFADTRQKYTVTFKDEDGTTLETKTNVYQGSSVSATSTPTKPDDGGKHYTFSKWVSDTGVDMTSSLADVQGNLTVYASYTISYKTGRYIAGTFPAGTSEDWTVSGAVYMTKVNSQEYTATVTLAFGDLVKTPYYNGSSFEYNLSLDSYDALTYASSAYYCFGSNGGSNHEIKCYAAGSYTFYFTDGNYDTSYKISVAYNGSMTAQHLAAKLMNFTEYAGHCGDSDRFPAMKTIFLGLSASEKSTFQGYANSEISQFTNAYNRYVAWARALGENPWAEGKANNSAILFGLVQETTNSIGIIVIISLVSLSAIGGYFFLRRRKAQ